ncbi:MAG: hypothetical protein A2360_03395 [Candidatus Staskawiczbacteria bacterium RIFOXYB1_FULL_32_11]|uniref:Uncharacterized protein n=1 Tax=Candidatus Staskawiczbacteria bacterium RIFOXYD1_FULL_32_13 TaxID=1802234 RepID=A0A1G2JN27_9BACT|nr:MAG: hypothetical protein A2256_01010 [Candidatus Staskawiczbacteria bacterium RIFOXYA2_FULL_32_7]OGZ78409.1 MAG: hypothetical protein A2360_03395 [Candidatus Staskawiczbacteria bacterium RIFOXYB1_FULL_32_11]OGZ86401.1 MAG: hypothetical protein A2463_03000 [Candidatus Staskawiczbacteria bacterium RIFOXYC2_FULL_32_10]OGZ87851.1 MAG: hypothetical protein A2561_04805 [Candidatus Staskawiczbacteria bacterium RIFOXYD1_FULL_32_13]
MKKWQENSNWISSTIVFLIFAFFFFRAKEWCMAVISLLMVIFWIIIAILLHFSDKQKTKNSLEIKELVEQLRNKSQ